MGSGWVFKTLKKWTETIGFPFFPLIFPNIPFLFSSLCEDVVVKDESSFSEQSSSSSSSFSVAASGGGKSGSSTRFMARLTRPLKHRKLRLAAMFVSYLLLFLLSLLERQRRPVIRRVGGRELLDTLLRGARTRADFIFKATKHSDMSSLATIRVNMDVFQKLCATLVHEGGLQKTNNVDVDEMNVMFLHTVGHNTKNRILQLHFGRSSKTICAVIHAVISSILNLHRTLYRKAVPVPDHYQHMNWKHFKKCLGALDGTHVKVRTNIIDQPRYRNRKGEVSINVLGVCNPKGEFIYCLSGWEGSAHDARVLRDALSRPHGLTVPKGSYYLCDAVRGISNPF